MNWTLLHKYLTKECDPEEMHEVETWIRADERNRRFMETLEKIWEVEPKEQVEFDSKTAWEQVQEKMKDTKPASSTSGTIFEMDNRQAASRPRKRFARPAAVAFLAAAVVVIAFLFYQYMPQSLLTPDSIAAVPEPREIVTEPGQRTTMQLMDGTRVQLNSNSKIVIPPEYNDSQRVVRLEGEGFFEVASDSSKPFIVQSGDTYTRVLGTRFGVRTYSAESKVQVVVAEGKVAMGVGQGESQADEIFIVTNQKGVISKKGLSKTTHIRDLDRYIGWKDGKLVFDDTPLNEVVPELERWYDIEIVLEDITIRDLRFNAKFQNESLTEVLNILALSLDLNYNRNGRTVVFKKKG